MLISCYAFCYILSLHLSGRFDEFPWFDVVFRFGYLSDGLVGWGFGTAYRHIASHNRGVFGRGTGSILVVMDRSLGCGLYSQDCAQHSNNGAAFELSLGVFRSGLVWKGFLQGWELYRDPEVGVPCGRRISH